MKVVRDFNEYQILDMSEGMKLENWNGKELLRPDPQIIWNNKEHPEYWDKVDAIYTRSNKGGGAWEVKNKKLPESWQVHYKDLTFNLKLMGFKHTGLFPEQAYNWNLIREKIKEANRPVKVLNLFAYTGAASVAALSAGAEVVHVDSSRGMIDWAKENVIATFFTLACCIVSAANSGAIDPSIADLLLQAGEASEDGIFEVTAMIQATGISWPALISFIIFNMTTIPCFAAVGTARGELTRKQFHGTLVFWVVTSYIVSMIVYLILLPFDKGTSYLWTYLVVLVLASIIFILVKLYDKVFNRKTA